MSNLNDFISAIKVEGLARTNRYSVIMTPPPSLVLSASNDVPDSINFMSRFNDMKRILLFCDQVQIPGLNLSTIQNRSFGEFREVPYEKLFENITMNFYVDTSMNVKLFFDNWMSSIQNPTTRSFSYYETYITDIVINVEDLTDSSRYSVKLFECYPKAVSSIQMDYAGKDVMKLQVTMMYKYWQSSSMVTTNSPDLEPMSMPLPDSYFSNFIDFQNDYNNGVVVPGMENLFDSTMNIV